MITNGNTSFIAQFMHGLLVGSHLYGDPYKFNVSLAKGFPLIMAGGFDPLPPPYWGNGDLD